MSVGAADDAGLCCLANRVLSPSQFNTRQMKSMVLPSDTGMVGNSRGRPPACAAALACKPVWVLCGARGMIRGCLRRVQQGRAEKDSISCCVHALGLVLHRSQSGRSDTSVISSSRVIIPLNVPPGPCLRLSSLRVAKAALAGIELIHLLRKGQFNMAGGDSVSIADQF
jgi:hypothetical protein